MRERGGPWTSRPASDPLSIYSGTQDLPTQGSPQWLAPRRDRIDLGFRAGNYLFRQRRILQVLCKLFAVMNSPPEKINQCLSFVGVLLLLVSKNVGVTRNRISVLPGGVRDRDSQVFRCLR